MTEDEKCYFCGAPHIPGSPKPQWRVAAMEGVFFVLHKQKPLLRAIRVPACSYSCITEALTRFMDHGNFEPRKELQIQ